MIKPEFIDGKAKPIDGATYKATIHYFENVLKLMHPFMPFITEEIWHLISERGEKDFIMLASWPTVGKTDPQLLEQFRNSESLVVEIRNFRNSKGISPKEGLQLFVKGGTDKLMLPVVKKLGNLMGIDPTEIKVEHSYGFIQNNIEYYIPFTDSVDIKAERSEEHTSELQSRLHL